MDKKKTDALAKLSTSLAPLLVKGHSSVNDSETICLSRPI